LIDIWIGSKEFPQRLTGVTDEREALVELKSRYGCALVGMTIGAAGAVVYCDGKFIESPGFEAPGACRDTTGAGDAFRGGFLSSIIFHHSFSLQGSRLARIVFSNGFLPVLVFRFRISRNQMLICMNSFSL
jgi:sugar/nucleoside kinase (ribokinase family)